MAENQGEEIVPDGSQMKVTLVSLRDGPAANFGQ